MPQQWLARGHFPGRNRCQRWRGRRCPHQRGCPAGRYPRAGAAGGEAVGVRTRNDSRKPASRAAGPPPSAAKAGETSIPVQFLLKPETWVVGGLSLVSKAPHWRSGKVLPALQEAHQPPDPVAGTSSEGGRSPSTTLPGPATPPQAGDLGRGQPLPRLKGPSLTVWEGLPALEEPREPQTRLQGPPQREPGRPRPTSKALQLLLLLLLKPETWVVGSLSLGPRAPH